MEVRKVCFGKPHAGHRAQIVADGAAEDKKLLTGRVNVSWSRLNSVGSCRGAFGRQPARKSVFHFVHSQSGVMDMTETTKHVCRVGTARIDYQGRVGQRVLNTTVKSGTGLGAVFAPTWKMVMASKQNMILWQTYVEQYTALMRQRYQANPAAFLEALSSDELIVCCYCKDTHATTKHCHRYILVEILEKVATHHNIGFEAIGEVRSSL
jgi:uncharacterized protein YeaO (DUF488 family)